jgi:hypothetical protein
MLHMYLQQQPAQINSFSNIIHLNVLLPVQLVLDRNSEGKETRHTYEVVTSAHEIGICFKGPTPLTFLFFILSSPS